LGGESSTVEDSEYLFTIAEVSAAFAGFAGLVTVLSQRLSGGASEFGLKLLRNMLLLALLTVLASLAPYVVARLGVAEPSAWRIAAAAFFLGWFSYLVAVVPSAFKYVRAAPLLESGLWYPHLGLHAVAGGALLAIAAGRWAGIAPGLYILVLFIMLYMVCYLLLRLFMAIGRA
jgi:hypothetical protein